VVTFVTDMRAIRAILGRYRMKKAERAGLGGAGLFFAASVRPLLYSTIHLCTCTKFP